MTYWFMKIVFCTYHCPKKGLKYHVETAQTILVHENCLLYISLSQKRGEIPKHVLTPQKRTSWHIFKMALFS